MEIPEKKNDVPSRFELQVLKELNEKKQQTGSNKINSFLSSIPQPFIKAGEWLKKIPGLDKIADNTKQAVSDLFQNFQSEKFSFDAIIEKYKDSGYVQINNPDDISTLDLEDIEPLIGDICKKYQTLVSDEESDYTSALSLHGVPKDIVALINLNRKAVNEYAAHYGFDISLEKERLFALNILEYAASENEFARKSVMERLVNQTKNMANKEAKEDIDKTPLGKLREKVDAHMKDLNEFYDRINTDEDVKKYTKMREHAISLRKDVVLTREAMGWRGDHHQLVSETWPLPPKKNVK